MEIWVETKSSSGQSDAKILGQISGKINEQRRFGKKNHSKNSDLKCDLSKNLMWVAKSEAKVMCKIWQHNGKSGVQNWCKTNSKIWGKITKHWSQNLSAKLRQNQEKRMQEEQVKLTTRSKGQCTNPASRIRSDCAVEPVTSKRGSKVSEKMTQYQWNRQQ